MGVLFIDRMSSDAKRTLAPELEKLLQNQAPRK
jgi:hypothetical protein